MVYKQNLHILIPIDKFEQLRELGHRMNMSRSELAREAIFTLLKKHQKRGEISGAVSVPTC